MSKHNLNKLSVRMHRAVSRRHVTWPVNERLQLFLNANDVDKLLKQKMMFCHQTWNDNFSRTCGGAVTTGTTQFFRPWSQFVRRILKKFNQRTGCPVARAKLNRSTLVARQNFEFRLSRVADKFLTPRSHLLPPSGCLGMTLRLPLYCLIAKQLCLRALWVSE